MKRRVAVPLIAIVIAAAAAVAGTVAAGNEPQLGLDLQGGFSVVLTAKGDVSDESVEKAKQIIRQRIDGLGVAEPEVTRQGKNVVIQLPGVRDRQKAQEIVGQTAKLEFRPVLEPAALGYRYDAENEGDPCVEDTAATTTTTAPGSTTTPSGSSTTVPGASTAPATSAPTSSSTPPSSPTTGLGRDETGAPPAAPPAEGESAAAAVPRQDPAPTTVPATTTVAPDASSTTTTAPLGGATTTTAPAEAGDTIVVPTSPDANGPAACLKVGPVGFEGDDLSRATAELNPQNAEWSVSVAIKGGSKTRANTLFNACFAGGPDCPTKATAIVLDGRVQSFPTVEGQNLADGPSFVISGDFSQSEAKDLALVLRYGALPVEFERSAEQQVSATLGRDSLNAGVVAGIVGLLAVAVYMLVYYRGLGLVVILGLGVWSALMFSVISFLSARGGLALSLAGLTGIIVSVGTTVDSYVVYFERLKDEVKSGKTVRSSTERGFQRAFRTILTADVSSFIGAFLLWWLTVGPVRGFAFFLGLSVVLDIVVAYFFTRPLVSLLGRNRFFTEARFFGVARGLAQRTTPGPTAGLAVAGGTE